MSQPPLACPQRQFATASRIAGPLVLSLALLPPPAQAQPTPPRIRPSRDVTVSYTVTGEALGLVPGGLQGPVRLSWDAAGQRLRAEAAGRSQVALIDLRSHTAQAFDTTLRIALPLPLKEHDLQPLTLEGVRLVPAAKETVAGLACMGYRFDTPQGPGSVCLTPDGVPLKGQGTINGKPGTFTATSVSYGALAPSVFQVPPGYIALSGGAAASLGAAAQGGSQGASQGGLAGLAAKLGGAGGLGNLLGRAR